MNGRFELTQRAGLALLLGLALACLAPSAAQANRALQSEAALDPEKAPGGVIEGPCGVAERLGRVYVSAYYLGAVEVFENNKFSSSLGAGAAPEGPCQLATGPGEALYANVWHERVVRLKPSFQSFDTDNSTGVAVGEGGTLYANDRTYIAAYEPSGEPVGGEANPLHIGEGFLADAYGLAAFAGRLYVADAHSDTIEVFEADGAPAEPIDEINGSATPEGRFVSLTDAALAVDPSNGHLLVIDDLQPGFEHPLGAIYEFDASGSYLGKLPGAPIDGGPSGLWAGEAGGLLVTSGNSEEGQLFSYGPYSGLLAAPAGPAAGAAAQGKGAAPGEGSGAASGARQGNPPASASETIQHGRFRVGVQASLEPKKLPRKGTAPVRFSLQAKISAAKGSVPPQLQRIEIEINRFGHIEPRGLPVCEVEQIQPSTNRAALEACGPSLIGSGSFKAKVLISQQAPFPSNGKVYAFNGAWQGRPAILAHVYGTEPIPTSATIPFLIGRSHGTYGTKLTASLPQATSKWGYVTAIAMALGRSFSSHGQRRSYLSAGCPAPEGVRAAAFPLSRTSFAFAGGKKLQTVLNRSCRAG